ncbi:YbaK/EbsC family protein [Arthrobacter sp. 35W]|uniref:YbaK/EbsC family protein n=1 Tax=Arthrobacter sp. 35W TaxID=1132441 RepID=UPI0003FE8D96|nr:YbaK/EbsC family protein [Arthrobacter sp. 35W]
MTHEPSATLDPAAVNAVRQALLAAGAADTVAIFDDSVPTAEAAAAALGCEVGAIANSLVFVCGGEPLLILASGAARVDVRLTARLNGLPPIKRASPDFVLEHTGQEVGGVAPVGHPQPIKTLLDQSLAEYPILWAGAGHHSAMFSINYGELARISGATPTQVR